MNIKKNILSILLLILTAQVYAQHRSEILFEINQQIFTVKVGFTMTQKPVVTFFRDSIQIKTDTLSFGETRLYFRTLNKDTLINIRLIEYKKEYENSIYSNQNEYTKNEKMLSLDIYKINNDEHCKMYEYNKKTKNFNSVNGLEFIYKPIFLSSNPNYFISTKTDDSKEFYFITNLYTIKNLKCIPIAEMLGYTEAGTFKRQIVELYKIDKKDENKKTMIDRQMAHQGCYECPTMFSSDLYFTPSLQYWEKHFNDYEKYRLGIYQKLMKKQ
jgi:hypothetical protein